MKRDLRTNFSVINDIADRLYQYKRALETIKDTIISVDAKLERCSGKAVDALRESKTDLLRMLDEQKEEVTDLFKIFGDYYHEMTSIIAPVNFGQMMRIDRNDVYWNLNSISNCIETLEQNARLLAVTDYVYSTDEDELRRWRSNYIKLEDAQYWYISQTKRLSHLMGELWDLYNYKIIPFENKDDEFARRANALYNKYTNLLLHRYSNNGQCKVNCIQQNK
jgi:hypothetical protein